MPKNAVEILYAENDMVIEVSDLMNALTGDPLTVADVTVTLLDTAGSPVAGESWPKTMAAVPDLPGTYRATLSYALALQPNQRCSLVIAINGGAGLRGKLTVPVIVNQRNA